MPKVLLDTAMSLDGFISGPNDEDHGLHNYFISPSGPTLEVIEEGFRLVAVDRRLSRASEALRLPSTHLKDFVGNGQSSWVRMESACSR